MPPPTFKTSTFGGQGLIAANFDWTGTWHDLQLRLI